MSTPKYESLVWKAPTVIYNTAIDNWEEVLLNELKRSDGSKFTYIP